MDKNNKEYSITTEQQKEFSEQDMALFALWYKDCPALQGLSDIQKEENCFLHYKNLLLDGFFYKVFKDGHLIGFYSLLPIHEFKKRASLWSCLFNEEERTIVVSIINPQESAWYLDSFCLNPEERGYGVGKAVIKQIRRNLKNNKLILQCVDIPSLTSFYTKAGLIRASSYQDRDDKVEYRFFYS